MTQDGTIRFGYKLSSEEFSARELVRFARAAEEQGFEFALISDHYHPWTDREGESPFVWSVLGGIAETTRKLRVGTGVTCPTMRIHPALVAQATATVTSMMPGRFFLGVGTGENLNEHIVGEGWPEVEVRQQRLAEAIEIIRLLWKGGTHSHRGRYFTVQNARLYSRPEQPPPLFVAASGSKSAAMAGQMGDGLIGTEPNREMLQKFKSGGGQGKPCYSEVTVCFDENEQHGAEVAKEIWPIAVLPGPLLQELPLPLHFEKAGQLVNREQLANSIACGPSAEKHLRAVQAYVDAGYDHICIHQIGPKQEQFMEFYAREIFPRFAKPLSGGKAPRAA